MSSDRLRVVTWNCAGVPGGLLGIVTGRPHRRERFRLDMIAEALSSFDVICVQESIVHTVIAFVDRLAARLGMLVWQDRTIHDGGRRIPYGSGLAILVRPSVAQPMSARATFDVEGLPFDRPATGFDGWSAKGIASTTLMLTSGARVHLLNTHMQSDDPAYRPQLFRDVRERQVAALGATIDRLRQRDADAALVACGDFNIRGDADVEYATVLAPMMAARGLSDAVDDPHLSTFCPTLNTLAARFLPFASDARLDHLWVGDGARAHVTIATRPFTLLDVPLDVGEGRAPVPPSDHFALGMELTISAGSLRPDSIRALDR